MSEPDRAPREDGKERFAQLVEKPGMGRFHLEAKFYDMEKVQSPGGNCDIYTAYMEKNWASGYRKVAIKRLQVVVSEEDKVWKVKSATNVIIPYRLND